MSEAIVTKRIEARETHSLRQQILRPHQDISEMDFPGDAAPGAAHFAAYAGKEQVGVASITPECRAPGLEGSEWRVRGMAVVPAYRGRGIGGALLAACVAHAVSCAGIIIWCNARANATALYARHGFQIEGEPFDLPGIGPHYRMVLRLAPAPQ